MKNVEDIYTLSPMQQGLLFHTLADSERSAYVERVSWSLHGPLNVAAFRAAWEQIIQHHTILRTGFVNENVVEPLQIVRQRVMLPWIQHDWRLLPRSEQQLGLTSLLEGERRCFDLSDAPLMRLTLIRLGPERYHFVWSYHHLLLDGWSVSLILEEVQARYGALSQEEQLLTEGTHPYRDYIAWLQQQDIKDAENYWREVLRGFISPTLDGFSRKIIARKKSYRKQQGYLSTEATAALQATARQNQWTLNTLIQGAWGLLLTRYGSEDDVVFGTVVSGRPAELPGAESTVGLFINTLPLRVQVKEGERVSEWLKRLQAQQVEMRGYEYSPLIRVQQWSEVTPGRALFESIVVFENLPVNESLQRQMATVEVRDLVHHEMATGYPLTVAVVPGQQLRIQISYDISRFKKATIVRMFQHLEQILGSIAGNPEQLVGAVSMLTLEERHTQEGWNNTTRSFSEQRNLPELFARQAEQTPEAVAVVYEGEELRYGELNRRAQVVGEHLRRLGVKREECVGLCVERSVELVVGVLGIWKSGGAVVPLDPGQPVARLVWQAEDAGLQVVLVDQSVGSELAGKFATAGMQTVRLEREAEVPESESEAAGESSGEQLAYVIYTSGSTGRPKGVMVEHGQLTNTLLGAQEIYQFTAADVVPCLAPAVFDIFFFELLAPLLVGGSCLLLPTRLLLEPQACVKTLERITFLHATPALMREVVSNARRGGESAGKREGKHYGQLRRLAVGGDAVSPELVKGMREAFPQARIHIGYGPTEASIMCANVEVGAGRRVEQQLVGAPMANVRLRIYDRRQQLVPEGVVGEIYVAGAGVARGYVKLPELSRERFVEVARERCFRTGDLGRWLSDGTIEFVGRADGQVKVRGFRIEVGEIEAKLEAHEQVKQAVVLASAEALGEKRLVAYVVAELGEAPGASELRQHLQRYLPQYMIPSAFVALASMPLTAQGKIDRQSLPAAGSEGVEAAAYAAPRTATEAAVCGIWATVLKLERVGVSENFFEIGGHSLLATRVMSQVRQTLGVDVPLWHLFEQPTVASFAAQLDQLRGAPGAELPPEIIPVARADDLPLSFAQQRLWFIDQFQPGNAIYSLPLALRLSGLLDTSALRTTLSEVVQRHEVLRTTFRVENGEPRQRIAATAHVALPITDLSELRPALADHEARRLATEEAVRPFDLSRGPLLRVSLLRLSAAEHVVLFTMHHVVSDGWSLGVLVGELVTLYKAYVEGRGSPLPELAVQYADYAAWQREWLQGEQLERQVKYWQEQLSGAPAVLELAGDRSRPAVQSFQSELVAIKLSARLSEELKALSRQESATLFMTLLAVWQVLLGRFSGQDDIVVGAPIANRTRVEIEPLIGFFVNTLALRADLSADPSFSELLRQVRQVCLDAYAHQDVPFEKLVEELQPERSLSHSPIFQVMFALQNAPLGVLELPQLVISPVQWLETSLVNFELNLILSEVGGGLEGSLIYHTDLFDRATIERMGECFRILLEGVVSNPLRPISSLPLLSEVEQRALEAWHETARTPPHEITIHELFEQQVAATPDAVALVSETEQLTYQQLNQRANQLAHHLRSLGVSADMRIAVCLERSTEMMVALLAILKAGGAYVPLDPDDPLARLSYMLADAAAPVVITTTALLDVLPVTWAQVICLDTDWEGLSGAHSEQSPPSTSSPDNLAYVIYTSGSTGTPKGVCITHRGVTRLVCNADYVSLDCGEVILQYAPVTFDAATFEIWGALLNGARLVLMPPGPATLKELADRIRGAGVTTVWLTAGLFHLMVDEGLGALPDVRQLLAGGDVLSAAHVRRALEELPQCEVINGYGPTENTTFTCCHGMRKGSEVEASVSIGRPITNTQVYVLDGQMRVVPLGVVGELYTGGEGLARGYLNEAGLTAERFLPNPFSAVAGARLYRTGDLVRWRSEGKLQFAGRADGQVKVRGFRIELGEVEVALQEHAAVEAVVVVACDEGGGGSRLLVAYVVGDKEREQPTVEALQEHLRGRLPEYMMPSTFIVLERLPLTANGKVDRRALPAPEEAGALRGMEYLAPRTAVEEVLVGIWSEVLGVERVGVTDNFFELGGHSLLATQLISRVHEAFSVEVSLRQLFEEPTVGGLGLAVMEAVRLGAGVIAPPIVPVSREESLPLSFAQQRMWFFDQLQPNTPVYSMPFSVLLKGDLSIDALEQTLSEIVRRHEVLRTTFTVVDGQPVQVIHPPLPLDLSVIDLGQLDERQREQQAQHASSEEAGRPFDLSGGPLLRVSLLRLSAAEHVVLFTMHHVVSDGWSLGVLVGELVTLYKAYVEGRGSPLPELAVQYADYAAWQREWLQGEQLERQVKYWQEQLSGAPAVLELAGDRSRPAVQSFQSELVAIKLSARLSEELKALSRQESATLFMTLLAVWQVLLGRFSGQDDIVVGAPIANRTRVEIEPLIGFFVNTLALRADLSADPSFSELLRQVRQVCLDAYAHQDVPFEKLVEELQPERSLSHSPIFQVMFALQNAPLGVLELPQLVISPVQWLETSLVNFELNLILSEVGGGLEGSLIYHTDLFDRATIERMGECFRILLEAVVSNPLRPISSLPLLSEVEQQREIEWNDTQRTHYPRNVCIHDLFEAQAKETPESIALICGDERLTYAELSRRSNQLAGYLKGLGVGPESSVGVCAERSVEFVVAILSIFKSGGVYVPLDPAQPVERLAFIIRDASIAVLLTESHLEKKFAGVAAKVICLDSAREEIMAGADENFRHVVQPHHLAYIIYTSGSTGQPKGVMVEHGHLVNTMCGFKELHSRGPNDSLPCVSSFSSDISLLELLSPMLVGGRSLLVPTHEILDTTLARRMLKEVSWLHASSSLMRQFLSFAKEDEGDGGYNQLQEIFVGGDVVSPNLIAELHQTFPAARVHVGYGPTEATIICAAVTLDRGQQVGHQLVGRPLGNVKLRLYDRHRKLVPVGVAGEIYIGGAGVTRGYLKRDKLTREKYVEIEGERYYCSGDVGRRLADGTVAFVGRLDDQVKVNGFRIEIGEIEAALATNEELLECAVIARLDDTGERRLEAFVVAKNGSRPTARALRSHLSEKLPAHMIPSEFVLLDELPRSSLGKLDKRALAASAGARAELGEEYVAPETDVERLIAGVWREVLGVERVGVNDNFFEVGGTSLLLVKVHYRLQQVVKSTLTMIDLFKNPTVSSVAEYIERGHPVVTSYGPIYERVKKQNAIIEQQRELAREGRAIP